MFELIKVAVALVSIILVYRVITNNCNKYLAFAVLAIWLRYFSSGFHDITYSPIVAGFSINALISICIAGLGLIVIPKSVLALKKLISFYFLFAAIAVSGFVNMEITGTINVLVKWCYFLVLASCIFLSIRVQGRNDTFRKLLIAFFMPVMLQILSILLGHVKATEADGSASYIGGYSHEAAFSMIIVAFIFCIGLIERNHLRFRTTLFTLAFVLLILVNYRTAILTVLPLSAVFYFTLVEQRLKPTQKAPVLTVVAMVLFLVFVSLSITMQDRFADVGYLVTNLDLIFKAPEYFTENEQDIMSARVYIWSKYINEFMNANSINMLLGFGPESWSKKFTLYAHNTYVSNLYELGLIGFVCFLLMLINTLILGFSMKEKRLAKIVGFSIIGFATMNIATMPLWNIEGLIFFAVIVGTIFASRSSSGAIYKVDRQPN